MRAGSRKSTSTDIKRGRLRVFRNEEIAVRHILASCSIPVVYPWTEIRELPPPGGLTDSAAHAFDLALLASFEADQKQVQKVNQRTDYLIQLGYEDAKRMLGAHDDR